MTSLSDEVYLQLTLKLNRVEELTPRPYLFALQ
jgi:hypothetical protein